MQGGAHLRSPGPPGLAAPERFPWTRLVTAVFAVAIMLPMSWRAARPPGEMVRLDPLPPPRLTQVVAVDLQGPREPAATPCEATAPSPAPPAPAPAPPAATPAPPTPAKTVAELAARRHARRPPAHLRTKSRAVAQRAAPVDPWSMSYDPIAQAKLTRRRSELRREYIAAREQVAAFTGEDSGSAYLARQGGRQPSRQRTASRI
ncbi:hypothetical protein [Ramlibacter sp.]|uniref:hypothetical protein n=1 Tax=Ramlibacter sp. TaxID=1917967 RepID=UPI002BBAB6D8|nr:hypothetical protein [Ramlibacter sp.]HWI82302.1 hypothetical protein [Ramlibacter sp.]